MFPKLQKIIYHGDFSRCQRVRGDAQRMLKKLYESLGVNNGQVKQGWKPAVPLYTGEVVQLHIGLAMDTINIFAEGSAAVAEVSAAEKRIKECPCNCNMSLGVVTSAVLSGTPNTIYANVGLAEAPFYICSVDVCQNKVAYVGFANIIGADFTPWKPGMKVVVMAYNAFLFGCCLPSFGVMGESFARFKATGCKGIINKEHMVDINQPELGMDMEDHEWRTTYRILQMCALPLQLWEER